MPTDGQPDQKTTSDQELTVAADPAAEATQVVNTAPLAQELPYAGVKIKDRYRIERELGRGGFGIVYLAKDEQLHSRLVVIKVLLEKQSADSAWFTKKFRQEREALSRIDHPGIVGVLDAGEMPDGKPFLVMQYVDGLTLRDVMKSQQVPLPRIAQIVRGIGHALTAAHDRGVYHRDLKPENVMLQDLGDGEELVKIIDFGIATVMESQAAAGSEATRVAGSGSYMAPEQLLGQPISASDIYSLGVIAYEMVTGRRPYNPDSPAQLYVLQQAGVKAMPREFNSSLPPAAQDCILKALSFDAKQRHARAREFGEEFARAVASGAGSVQTAPRETSAYPGTAPLTGSAPQKTTPGKQPSLEMAHILFTDIVGYSLLPMDRQTQYLQQLQDVISSSEEFQRAQENDELIKLPTGDGMALVFFRDPVSPVKCATEISRSLKDYPDIKLRIGVHTGPVYRVADINANRNVAGGGINMAQRVMDSGDAGHIILSRAVAEVLAQLSDWSSHLEDLGEQEVKHGVRVHLFNLCTEDAGNRELPQKMRSGAAGRRASARRKLPGGAAEASKKKPALIAAAIAVAVLLAAGIGIGIFNRSSDPPAPSEPAPPAAVSVPERMFSYSIIVQRYRDGVPFREPFPLPGEIIFEADYAIRLVISSPQAGYLYILNEGPVMEAGMPSYNVMFPSEGQPALLTADQRIQIPAEQEYWIQFDEQAGTEKLWMIWTAKSVAELEAVKEFADAEHMGVIDDPELTRAIQAFLEKYSESPPVVERDDVSKQTNVQGNGDVLVRLLNLEHH